MSKHHFDSQDYIKSIRKFSCVALRLSKPPKTLVVKCPFDDEEHI